MQTYYLQMLAEENLKAFANGLPFGFLKKPFEIAQLLLYIEKRIKEGEK